jgi:hypothetical protein
MGVLDLDGRGSVDRAVASFGRSGENHRSAQGQPTTPELIHLPEVHSLLALDCEGISSTSHAMLHNALSSSYLPLDDDDGRRGFAR